MFDQLDEATLRETADRLTDTDATLATAESCTGGLLGAAFTAGPGSSDYFLGGITAYDYDTKRHLLGVSREALDEHGAVSARVAREMARGVRDRCDVTWSLSATGVAGPTGGTEETPVGTVYVGLAYAGPWGSETSFAEATRYEFDGDRAAVRAATVDAAVETLISAIDRFDA